MIKPKVRYFLLLISILLIGWIIYMITIDKVYIYNTMQDEQIDITSFYNTGKFYIYSDPKSPKSQKLIRRQPPKFWAKEDILQAIKNKTVPITYTSELIDNQDQVIEQIIMAYPDFSERMKYYSSNANENGTLRELFIGYFELDNKEYTLDITDRSYSTDRTDFSKVKSLTINLSKDFFNFPSSYEEFLEEAKKQPQPQL